MNTPPKPSALLNYPRKATFAHVLPKNKIYEHSGANTRIKDLFVEQVDKIVWQYKLAPETINLPSKPAVPEIQIFQVFLKLPEASTEILKCIDGAVQYPIVFELHYAAKVKVMAAYKRPSEADGSKWVMSDYFSGAWMPANSPRDELPLALHLGGLYEQLIQRLIPLSPRAQESLADLVERTRCFAGKQREIARISSRLTQEKQFNRKLILNATLRQLKQDLEQLSR